MRHSFTFDAWQDRARRSLSGDLQSWLRMRCRASLKRSLLGSLVVCTGGGATLILYVCRGCAKRRYAASVLLRKAAQCGQLIRGVEAQEGSEWNR